jgi:hypothetical protein
MNFFYENNNNNNFRLGNRGKSTIHRVWNNSFVLSSRASFSTTSSNLNKNSVIENLILLATITKYIFIIFCLVYIPLLLEWDTPHFCILLLLNLGAIKYLLISKGSNLKYYYNGDMLAIITAYYLSVVEKTTAHSAFNDTFICINITIGFTMILIGLLNNKKNLSTIDIFIFIINNKKFLFFFWLGLLLLGFGVNIFLYILGLGVTVDTSSLTLFIYTFFSKVISIKLILILILCSITKEFKLDNVSLSLTTVIFMVLFGSVNYYYIMPYLKVIIFLYLTKLDNVFTRVCFLLEYLAIKNYRTQSFAEGLFNIITKTPFIGRLLHVFALLLEPFYNHNFYDYYKRYNPFKVSNYGIFKNKINIFPLTPKISKFTIIHIATILVSDKILLYRDKANINPSGLKVPFVNNTLYLKDVMYNLICNHYYITYNINLKCTDTVFNIATTFKNENFENKHVENSIFTHNSWELYSSKPSNYVYSDVDSVIDYLDDLINKSTCNKDFLYHYSYDRTSELLRLTDVSSNGYNLGVFMQEDYSNYYSNLNRDESSRGAEDTSNFEQGGYPTGYPEEYSIQGNELLNLDMNNNSLGNLEDINPQETELFNGDPLEEIFDFEAYSNYNSNLEIGESSRAAEVRGESSRGAEDTFNFEDYSNYYSNLEIGESSRAAEVRGESSRGAEDTFNFEQGGYPTGNLEDINPQETELFNGDPVEGTHLVRLDDNKPKENKMNINDDYPCIMAEVLDSKFGELMYLQYDVDKLTNINNNYLEEILRFGRTILLEHYKNLGIKSYETRKRVDSFKFKDIWNTVDSSLNRILTAFCEKYNFISISNNLEEDCYTICPFSSIYVQEKFKYLAFDSKYNKYNIDTTISFNSDSSIDNFYTDPWTLNRGVFEFITPKQAEIVIAVLYSKEKEFLYTSRVKYVNKACRLCDFFKLKENQIKEINSTNPINSITLILTTLIQKGHSLLNTRYPLDTTIKFFCSKLEDSLSYIKYFGTSIDNSEIEIIHREIVNRRDALIVRREIAGEQTSKPIKLTHLGITRLGDRGLVLDKCLDDVWDSNEFTQLLDKLVVLHPEIYVKNHEHFSVGSTYFKGFSSNLNKLRNNV